MIAPPDSSAWLFEKLHLFTVKFSNSLARIAPPSDAVPFMKLMLFKMTLDELTINILTEFEASIVRPLPLIVIGLLIAIPSLATVSVGEYL